MISSAIRHFTLALAAAPILAWAASAPHLEMEMTSREYRALYERSVLRSETPSLKTVIDTGKRLLDWVDYVNKYRDPSNHLSLTSAETQPAYPIEKPRKINPEIIGGDYD